MALSCASGEMSRGDEARAYWGRCDSLEQFRPEVYYCPKCPLLDVVGVYLIAAQDQQVGHSLVTVKSSPTLGRNRADCIAPPSAKTSTGHMSHFEWLFVSGERDIKKWALCGAKR